MRYPRKWQLAFVCLLAASIIPAVAVRRGSAQSPTYTVTEVGTLGDSQSRSYGINNCGSVAGDFLPSGSFSRHPFIYDGTQLTDLGTFGGTGGSAFAVNADGMACGAAGLSNGTTHPFVWTKDSGKTNIDVSTVGGPFASGWAEGINDSGVVVGFINTTSLVEIGFIWQQSTGLQAIAGFPITGGGGSSEAFGVNNTGAVVGTSKVSTGGSHAFILKDGVMTDLGTFGGKTSIAFAVNSNGDVVGYSGLPSSDASTPMHAFFWHDADGNGSADPGELQDLGALGTGKSSEAFGINSSGQVVGYSETVAGSSASHAFIWDAVNGMKDLNDLAAGSGWTLLEARAINDRGQITGIGISPSGQSEAFLLTPDNVAPSPCAPTPTPTPTPSPTPTPALTTLAVSGSGIYNGTVTLTATLTSDNSPLGGKPVSFTLSNNQEVFAVCGGGTGVACPTTNSSGVATLSGVNLSGINAGINQNAAGASFAGDSNFSSSGGTGTLTVSKATPTVNWNDPADIVYGTPLGNTQLNATATDPNTNSSVGGTFSYAPLSGTVLHAGNNQTLHVGFTPTDTNNYNPPAQKTVSVNVAKATLTITADNKGKPFGAQNPPLTFTPGGFMNGDNASVLSGALEVSTTATDSSPVGDYPITIGQGTLAASDYNFNFVAGTLAVGKSVPVINWSNPADIVYGTPLGAAQLNATVTDPATGATVTGTFNYTPTAGTVLHAGGSQTLAVSFTPSDTTDYIAPPQKTVSINVSKATLTIKADDKSKGYRAANPTFTFGPSGFVNNDTAIVLSGSPSLTTSADVSSGIGGYPINAAQGTLAASDYNFNFVGGTLTVTKATPTINWANPADITFGTALGAAQLNAAATNPNDGSSVAGSFNYSPGTGTALNAGNSQTLALTFTPTDAVNYNAPAQKSVAINVLKANQTITFDAPSDKTLGDPNFVVSAKATSNLAVAFAASGQCTIVSGNTVHIAGAGSCTVTASQTGDNNYNAATPVGHQFTINKATATITLGNLAPTYDGTAKAATATTTPQNLSVSISYSQNSQPVQAPTNAGSYDVTATVSDNNYQGTATGKLVIGKATASITLGNLNQTYDGTQKFATATVVPVVQGVSFTYDGSTTAPTGAGSYTVVGTVNDPNYQGSSTRTLVITKANQTINFAAILNRTFGDPDFGVSATASSGLTVNFSATGNCSVVGSGTNSGTVHLTGTGSCTVTASQSGDANFPPASVAQSFQIAKAATATALLTSANPSASGQGLTLTATVSSAAGTPTGTVAFKDGGTTITNCGGVALSSGQAACTTSALSPGGHSITADYSGDSNFNASATNVAAAQVVGGIFNFSQATYSVNESANFLTVTVTRTGDTTTAATVDYATSDGTATAHDDYTTALGTLHFAAGDTSQSFVVLVTDDGYQEPDETINLTLSNPSGGASLGDTAAAAATIKNDNTASSSSGNPVDSSSAFVRQHYHDFLNREPDASGFQFWSNDINNCGADTNCAQVHRVNTSAAFFLSIEFQETGYLVERMYKTAFGDATGNSTLGGAHTLAVPVVRLDRFLPDTQRIGQGVVVGQGNWQKQLEDNKAAFASEFVQRQRFASAHPTTQTPAQFVDALFANAGITPSTTERNTAINEFGASATDTANTPARARALRDVAESASFSQAEFNRAFVLMQFFGYLRRNPNDAPDADYTGYEFWLQKLDQFNGDFVKAEMVKAFISSDEYRHRFGQ